LVVRPSTLLHCHRALIGMKYRVRIGQSASLAQKDQARNWSMPSWK
jgi:hypothetical protein